MSNPWEAPGLDEAGAGAEVAGGRGPWRDGDLIVDWRESTEPWLGRCPVCDAPASGEPLRMPLQWMPRWVPFLILFGMLPYLIAFFLTRWNGYVHVRLCDAHKARRRNGQIVMYAGLAAMLGGFFAGMLTESLALMGGGFVALVPIVIGALMMRTVYPQSMDATHVRLKGACDGFLARLPPYRG